MSIFAIGDLHLSNSPGTDKPMDVFGDLWYNYTERIRGNWCRIINNDDTIVIAGDTSWALKFKDAEYDLEWIDKLPGRKILIKGNHDLWWSGITKMNEMYDSISFLQNNSIEIKGCWICGSRGWITPDDTSFTENDRKIYNRELIRLEMSLESAPIDGEKIVFLHYPPSSDIRAYTGFMDVLSKYGVREVYYGHLHGRDAFAKARLGDYYGVNYRLISADYLGFAPLLVRK